MFVQGPSARRQDFACGLTPAKRLNLQVQLVTSALSFRKEWEGINVCA